MGLKYDPSSEPRYSHSGTFLLKSSLGGGGVLCVQVVSITCYLSPEPETLHPTPEIRNPETLIPTGRNVK